MLPTPRSAPSLSRSRRAATGIRDAAGNLSSFAASAPVDGARPVPIAVGPRTTASPQVLMEAGNLLQVTFCEQLAALGSAVTTITETDRPAARAID